MLTDGNHSALAWASQSPSETSSDREAVEVAQAWKDGQPISAADHLFLIHRNNSLQPDLRGRLERHESGKVIHRLGLKRFANDEKLCRKMLRGLECMTCLECGHFLEGPAQGTSKVRRSNACRSYRTCENCARVRQGKLAQNCQTMFQQIAKDHPGFLAFMWTFTLPTGRCLKERSTYMSGKVRSMLARRRQSRFRACNSVMRHVLGGTYSFETTTGKGRAGLWHYHCHLIVIVHRDTLAAYGSVASFSEAVRREWVEHNPGERCSVNAQDCRQIEGTIGDILQALKYPFKFCSMTPAQTLYAFETLQGTRTTGTFGCFHGMDIDPEIRQESSEELFKKFSYLRYWLSMNRGRYVDDGSSVLVTPSGKGDCYGSRTNCVSGQLAAQEVLGHSGAAAPSRSREHCAADGASEESCGLTEDVRSGRGPLRNCVRPGYGHVAAVSRDAPPSCSVRGGEVTSGLPCPPRSGAARPPACQ